VTVLPAAEVVRHAQAAGFRGDALITAVAIAKAESGFDTNALGDTTIQTAVWGPSVGLWQIRSLKAESGSGKTRDQRRLTDPAFNARSAYAISGGGVNFAPWSVFKNGAYKQHLSLARTAVSGAGGVAGAIAGAVVGGVFAGTTAGTTGGGATSPTSMVPGGPPVLAESSASPSGAPLPVRIGGKLAAGELGQAVIGGSIEFSTQQVSEMTLVLDDPGLKLTRRHRLNIGTVLDNYGLRWQVVEPQLRQAKQGESIILRCHPSGAVRLRTSVPSASAQISPTKYMAALARQAGLRFVGENSAPRDIAPAMIDDTRGRITIKRPQTAWEVGQHWAKELGFLFFEAAGTLYFGSPKFLAAQGRRMQISWGTFSYPTAQHGPVYPALELPSCKGSQREFFKKGTVIPGINGLTTTYYDTVDSLKDITVSAKIERTTGEALRPGMSVSAAGVPPFDATFLLMTKVGWSLSDLTAPVVIEAATAEVLAAPARTADDDTAAVVVTPPGTTRPLGSRIGTADRIRYFGQPGDRQRATTIGTVFGIPVTINLLIIEQFKAAALEAMKVSKWRPRRIDSYNVRPVRGSDDWSLHSFGLAFDFFSSAPGVHPPGGVWAETSAPDKAFRDAFKRHGFHLGSDFSRRKDYPHIEWASAPPS
jgi:hypothetical protein